MVTSIVLDLALLFLTSSLIRLIYGIRYDLSQYIAPCEIQTIYLDITKQKSLVVIS